MPGAADCSYFLMKDLRRLAAQPMPDPADLRKRQPGVCQQRGGAETGLEASRLNRLDGLFRRHRLDGVHLNGAQALVGHHPVPDPLNPPW